MRRNWDWLAFSQIIGIGSISLLIISSISTATAQNQFIFWALGLSVFYISSHLGFRVWEHYAKLLYLLSIFLLLILLFVADPVRGSIRWFDLGIFRVQPSEIAKITTLLVLVSFFKEKSAANIKNLFTSISIILPPFILVLIQPDIGSSLTFLAIWFGIVLVAGLKTKHLLAMLIASAVSIFMIYELLAPYQRQRITTFLSPEHDPLGTGYNIIQSKIAIGSGGFFGKGFGQGSQSILNFLPEAESDFIFASISEQLGFVGAGLLIILFAWLIQRVVAFSKDKERYAQLIIVGVVSLLGAQFVINVGMNLALLPVTGITFPLVSYGGSSLITTLFLLGVAFSVNRSLS